MTSPLRYRVVQELVSDLARADGREGLARRAVPHCGQVGWLSRVLVKLRRRTHREAPPMESALPAAVVDLPGRAA
jgi:hypothetical protein